MSPSKRRARRAADAILFDEIRGFIAHYPGFCGFFGMCDDCGGESYLRQSANEVRCSSAICDDCLGLRNRWPSTCKKFGISGDEASDLMERRRAANPYPIPSPYAADYRRIAPR